MKQITSKRYFGLDLLRALSVGLILFSHTSWIYTSEGLFGKLEDMSGFFGLELFIILSGFLIGGILYRQFLHEDYTLKDGLRFISRRLMRILPSYYLVILLNAIVFTVYGFSVSGIWKYFLMLQNFASPVSSFFPESWSLPVKEIGYIFAVLLLLLVSRFLPKTSKRFLFFLVIIGLILLTFVFKINYNNHSANVDLKIWSFEVRSVVIYRMDSVLIGVLLGYFYSNYNEAIMSKRKLFLIGGILLLFMMGFVIMAFRLTLSNAGWFWNIACLPLVSLAICMFFPFLLNLEAPTQRIENIIRFVCKISYSVYLLHYSLILFLLKNLIDTSNLSIWQLHLFTLLYLLVTVGLSFLLYNYFEKPINEYRIKKLKLNVK